MFVCVSPAVSHVVIGRFVLGGHLDPVGQEAEDGASPEQHGEAAEQLATELDPLRCGGGRGECVGTVPRQDLHGSGIGQTLKEENDSLRSEVNVSACGGSLNTTVQNVFHSQLKCDAASDAWGSDTWL